MKKLDKLGVMAAGEGMKFKASYDGEAKEIEEYKEDGLAVPTRAKADIVALALVTTTVEVTAAAVEMGPRERGDVLSLGRY
jgi:hypothetical protein